MKARADLALAARGLAPSREKARALILAGRAYVGERKLIKPSETVGESEELIVRGETEPFASRGGLKLSKALDVFGADPGGLAVLDIGAAAGGFTDVLLRRGAALVYAVDVGYGQLDWRLRNDSRVVVMERTNARALRADMFPVRPGLAVMDVSFISLRLIVPAAAALMGGTGRFIVLVKPQFEAGRADVGKGGVVRAPAVHARVLRELRDFCPAQGLRLRGLTWSPVKGPKGNIEFLADILPGEGGAVDDARIEQTVLEAHGELDTPRAAGRERGADGSFATEG